MRPTITLAAALTLFGAAAYADRPPATTPPAPSVAPIAQANSVVSLRYKFVAGQDLKYEMSSTTSGTINIGAREMPIVQTLTTDYHMFTKSVDKDGNGTLSVSFTNPKMTMTLNGSTMPIPSDQLQKSLGAINGMTMVMSPQGKLIKLDSGGASTGGVDINKMLSSGSSAMSNMAILPDRSVNIGDSWRGSMDLATLGVQTYLKMTLDGINTLSGTNVAQVTVKTHANIAPKISTSKATNVTGTMDGLGTMGFDIDNGYQKSFDENMNIKMTMTPSANAPANTPAVGGNIQLTSKVSMNLVDVSIISAGTGMSPAATPTPATPAAPTTNQ